jgi:hypothetical protein
MNLITALKCVPLASLALLVSAAASAQADPASFVEPVAPSPAPSSAEPVERYSAGTALGLAALGTAVGYGAFIGGLQSDNDRLAYVGLGGIVLGPSVGHIYTGDFKRALIGVGIRTAGPALLLAAAATMSGECLFDGNCSLGTDALMAGGYLLTLGGTAYSLIDAPLSARRRNVEAEQSISLGPVFGPQSTGIGLQAIGSF